MTTQRPSEQLTGSVINGYLVGERVPALDGESVGYFSACYRASKDGNAYFIKATDLSYSEGTTDSEKLQATLGRYNMERFLLSLAKQHAMRRVVQIVASGEFPIQAGAYQIGIYYLVFDCAECSLRHVMLDDTPISTSAKLRALHHVAGGLAQLHAREIAHQDVKPSNVLSYKHTNEVADYKVADLGRASKKGNAAPHDVMPCPGDWRYAPIEQRFGFVKSDFEFRRIAGDTYMLGSLISILFGGISITQSIIGKLPEIFQPRRWHDEYSVVLPHVRVAFDGTLVELDRCWPMRTEDPQIAAELQLMVRQLCEPDPMLRGHPRARARSTPFDLQRYISKLDSLAIRATRVERSENDLLAQYERESAIAMLGQP